MALIITDLDNTLYDWVTFFAASYSAMVEELSNLIEVDQRTLLDEFKAVHQRYGNPEQPFAILELPSVRRAFGNLSRVELVPKLERPLATLDEARAKHLRLYGSVEETLAELQRRGHVIVGHIQAIVVNSYYRMVELDIVRFFTRLYALEGQLTEHPNPNWKAMLTPPEDFVKTIPRAERKPNPNLLMDICKREGFRVEEALYIGDSFTRDVGMAKAAGVYSVWARYGTQVDRQHWDVLESVTHRTDEDMKRDDMLRRVFRDVCPDRIIDSFGEIIDIINWAGFNGPR